MAADSLTVPLATDVVGHLEKRLVSSLEMLVEDWSESASALSSWEDEHLLDAPGSDLLARHKTTVEHLIRIGKLLSIVAAEPDFPNRGLHQVIASTLHMLHDKLRMWHGGMSPQQREKIVNACFP
jgi:hypothetical protein